jgi:hypothetical protein
MGRLPRPVRYTTFEGDHVTSDLEGQLKGQQSTGSFRAYGTFGDSGVGCDTGNLQWQASGV